MKSTIKIFFFLFLSMIVCASCSKNDDNESSTSNQSLAVSGGLSGTIVNYVSTEVDKVTCYSEFGNDSILGTSILSSAGKFSMTLPTINTGLVSWKSKIPKGVIFSDSTALYGVGYLNVYKGTNYIGELRRCNFTGTIDSLYQEVGNTASALIYSEKSITVKGTYTYNSGSVEYYNFTLAKGWNEIAFKTTAHSTNSSGNTIYTISYTNDIPTDLQWRYFKESSSSVKKQNAKRTLFSGIF